MSGAAAADIRLVFDFALREDEPPSRLVFAAPVYILAAYRADEVQDVLRAVEEATVSGGLWAAGFVTYEAASAFDLALVTREPMPGMPLAWFGVFAEPSPGGRTPPPGRFGSLSPSPSEREGGVPGKGGPAQRGVWQNPPQLSAVAKDGLCSERPLPFPKGRGKRRLGRRGGRAIWTQSIAAVHDAIARGETYQVNLTRRIHGALPAPLETFAVYEQMRAAQAGARYAAFLDTGTFQIASTSPELFFATEGRRIVTRPMKGTARRGRWTEEDERLAAELAASEKDRAENVMIVDLLRNDLGKIAETGSVRVPDLFTVERYPTVFQMTSTVEATLPEGTGLTEIFAALFPCGSITGAPKVSTMQIIADLEREPRGVYCGAIGVVRPGGDAVFNVGIRTLVHDSETGKSVYGVGGGITWDSTADDEWAETEAKAAVLTQFTAPRDFDLLETLQLENGVYFLCERHLRRLVESTAFFERSIDTAAVSRALDSFAERHSQGIWRVRLCVAPEGTPSVEGVSLRFSPADPLPVMLAKTPIDSRNVLFFHKTTRREIYEAPKQALPEGVYDVLLWNENGEVTEFTIGNIVAEIDGVRWTPPRDAGLLAGTFRAHLLETGEIRERTLTIAEVAAASRIWLVNSVRGWVPVCLIENRDA